MTIKIQTRADLFAATALCISKDNNRFYLCGVNFQAEKGKKSVIAATDGSILTVASDGLPFEGEGKVNIIITPTTELLKACKQKNALNVSFEIAKENPYKSPVTWVVGNPDGELSRGFTSIVDGVFPEYQRIIPKESFPKLSAPTISHTYYKIITDIAKTAYENNSKGEFFKPEKSRSIKIIRGDENSNQTACFVKYANTKDIFSIIMPVKEAVDIDIIPNFF